MSKGDWRLRAEALGEYEQNNQQLAAPHYLFRRQVPLLGRFMVDFLAPAERLVIEVDGGHHAE